MTTPHQAYRVAVIPADRTACGHYRLTWPAAAVAQARPDWVVKVHDPGRVQIATNARGDLTRVRGIDLDEWDLVVTQRTGLRASVQFLQAATQRGVATVLDVDDAMWCIHPDNKAHASWNMPGRAGQAGQHWRWIDAAAQAADLTTVTTGHLARRYGTHGRVEVIGNHIPRLALEAGEARDTPPGTRGGGLGGLVAYGWAGHTNTHPRDLQAVGDAIQKVQAHLWEIAMPRVIGDAAGAARDWGLSAELVDRVRPVPLGPAYYAALTHLDIGLVPLTDSGFNRGKSWLKALEFSTAGVPVIASPTPANTALAGHLPILLAHTPQEWLEHLTRLITNGQERRERGAEARKLVERDWTIEGNAEVWATAWERAITRRRNLTN